MDDEFYIQEPLSGIGIDDLYLYPPDSQHSLNENQNDSLCQEESFYRTLSPSYEIVGTLKSKPEDFVVNEISIEKNVEGFIVKKAAKIKDQNTLPFEELKKEAETAPTELNPQKTNLDQSMQHGHQNEGIAMKVQSITRDKIVRRSVNAAQSHTLCNKRNLIESDNELMNPFPLNSIQHIQTFLVHTVPLYENKMGIGPSTIDFSHVLVRKAIESIKNLHNTAKEQILGCTKFDSETKNHENVSTPEKISILLPPEYQLQPSYRIDIQTFKEKQAKFHQSIRSLFPLLKTCTNSEKSTETNKMKPSFFINVNSVDQNHIETNANKKKLTSEISYNSNHSSKTHDSKITADCRFLTVEIDKMFFGLIPHLLFPLEDLLKLYEFRNDGAKGNEPVSTKREKRRRVQGFVKGSSKSQRSESSENFQETLLRIKTSSDVKEIRRQIHHMISSTCKNFETMTRSIPNDTFNENSVQSTSITAIVVRWSRRAYRKKSSKHSESKDEICTNLRANEFITHCVLQKRQVEHLACINVLKRVIKCRPSDIGMAGIKDVCAVTSQFVTFRSVTARELVRANEKLKSYGIVLGNFSRKPFFHGSNLDSKVLGTINEINKRKTNMLNRGDLFGNQFTIRLRNIYVKNRETVRKGYASVDTPTIDQLDAMVQRISSHGFINYYGEQRVGEAGPFSKVGIRPFDIGRAMLQENFNLAVDYLMMGRKKTKRKQFMNDPKYLCDENIASSSQAYVEPEEEIGACQWVYAENECIREARALWQSSNGDVSIVLKHMNSSSKQCKGMTRERIVLQGLKRYGNKNCLKALQSLHFNIRFFWINAYQSYVWNLMVTYRIKKFGLNPIVGDLYYIRKTEDHIEQEMDRNSIKVITDENMASTINFSSIVLPLPGHDVIYPKNEIGFFYSRILKQHKVVFDKNKIMESTAKGSYRHIVSKVQNLRWEPEDTIPKNKKNAGNIECDEVKQKKMVQTAKFSFELERGSYATMMLRELLLTKMLE